MPIDKKGSGGSGGGTKILPTQMPDLYDPNKTIRLLIECNNQTGGSPASPGTMVLTTSATATAISMDGDRPCIFEFASSATANSGVGLGFSVGACPPITKPTLTIYFKMPSVIDANTTIQLGTYSVASADRTGLEIIGSTLQGKVIVGGLTTQSGGTYTMSADTWYIARIAYTSNSAAVCTLYSATGTLLYTFTITTALFAGILVGLRATNSGTVAKAMCRVDMIEAIIPINNRFYLPV